MGECKKCGNCCRYLHIDFEKVNRDQEWADSRRGIVMGDFVFFKIPCKYLVGNLCSRHEDKPQWCKDWPDNIGLQPFMKAYGCRYFDE